MAAPRKQLRRRIPTGAGSVFVLTESTLRIEGLVPRDRGELSTGLVDLFVAAGGSGAVVLMAAGAVERADPGVVVPISALEAVELLQRSNLVRITQGRPAIAIPSKLLRRAKALAAPETCAEAPFPGILKNYFAGRGAWAGSGLWVSCRGEFELELAAFTHPSAAPVVMRLRKRLSEKEACAWMLANGYSRNELETFHGGAAPPPPTMRGSRGWRRDRVDPAAKRAEEKARAAVARAPLVEKLPIDPPRKPTRAQLRRRRRPRRA